MPIISSTLDYARPQRDGAVRVRERHTDSKGRNWYLSYKAASEVEANANMAARDFTAQLEDKEENDAIEFIEAGGDPGSFVKVDLTSTQYNRRLAKKFANSHTHLDRQFVCNVVSWVAGFTAVQIANALGVSEAKGTAILNRAITLRDDVCPALVVDDGKVEDI